ncbi:hypothetical protein [Allorhizocola rhizosphaerae]|uniref:hypothetical protein n=1 Tax=Allorhizocola rhizosphaerae TaxID=1872709 RepID=UPI0013C2F9E9|nr:hypothetical protein [Allorhizocola rhizosphaerae]
MTTLDTGSIVAIASAALSILAAVISGYMAQRSSKLEHRLQQERHRETKAEQTEEIISRYREPLLLAANSLQSRMHNAVGGDYLPRFLHCGDPEQERYARDFTVYTVAEYLCWVEIIRRELRFLDLGTEERTREFNRHLETVSRVMLLITYEHDHFRLFRGQQRAIGELMMVTTNAGSDCMTYPVFSSKLEHEPEFARWFARLRRDVDAFLTHDWNGNIRQVHLQWALIDLIDFLDPNEVRLTQNRAKLVENDWANRITAVPAE